jgi:hypothetical protein
VNFLTGTIPVELGLLTGLEVLLVEFNNLGGSVSDEICALRSVNLTQLTVDCTDDSVNFVQCDCCTNCPAPATDESRTTSGLRIPGSVAWLRRHTDAATSWQNHLTAKLGKKRKHAVEEEEVHNRNHVTEKEPQHTVGSSRPVTDARQQVPEK